jgi:putative tricarboxylic transport membrane protein
MRRAHQVTATVCIGLAALVMSRSLTMKLYTSLGPGPGFFPFWLAALFGLLALVMLVQATVRRPGGRPDAGSARLATTRAGYARIAAILGALIGVVLLMNPLGFRLTALAFYLFLLTTLSRPGWIATVLIAVAGSFGVYQVFATLLRIPLPVGLLGI